jgi:hypothetical protein
MRSPLVSRGRAAAAVPPHLTLTDKTLTRTPAARGDWPILASPRICGVLFVLTDNTVQNRPWGPSHTERRRTSGPCARAGIHLSQTSSCPRACPSSRRIENWRIGPAELEQATKKAAIRSQSLLRAGSIPDCLGAQAFQLGFFVGVVEGVIDHL